MPADRDDLRIRNLLDDPALRATLEALATPDGAGEVGATDRPLADGAHPGDLARS